ncbi:Protease PrsW [Thalassocella blandensis]|nr:Protease PrsW [Thalassocella blandensis]
MYGWSLLSLLLVPCFFWGAYHYYKDRHRPEPILLLVLALLLGIGSAYLGLFFYQCLDAIGLHQDAFALASRGELKALFLYAIFAIGPIEECVKFLPFLLILVRTPHFDEPLDGVVYASFVALGFSLHENMYYLQMLEGKEAIGRAFASPIVHALFASIWGYAYGYADLHKINRVVATTGALILASLLHGIYDFFALWISVWTHVVPASIILAIWLWRMNAIRHTPNTAEK